MGRRSLTGGVRPKGTERIELEFTFQGKRYRPTLPRKPTPSNLRRAYVQLATIDRAIAEDSFDFDLHFPRYRLNSRKPQKPGDPVSHGGREDGGSRSQASSKMCNNVFDAFLAHSEARVRLNDLAYSTYVGYQQIFTSVWRPRIGDDPFLGVTYSRLQSVLSDYATKRQPASPCDSRPRTGTPLKKRTYNNIASAVRCAFEFGYKDHLDAHNPALRLKTLRITRKDRKPIDPFTIHEAEAIIAQSYAAFGEAHGNYEVGRFFTGVRPSEALALTVADYDRTKATLAVRGARVQGREKDRTKTHEDREIALCVRAQAVIERQLALRERLARFGPLRHDFLFFQEDGTLIQELSYPGRRWRRAVELAGVRYRAPNNARHSFISWSLMVGKNLLKLAQEDGHSVHTMLSLYAAWIERATEADVALIHQAMSQAPETQVTTTPSLDARSDDAEGAFTLQARRWAHRRWRKHRQATRAICESR